MARNQYTAAWPRERWRAHQKSLSDFRKKQNSGVEPNRSGRRRCPKCQTSRSRQNYCRAVRQPDGLQNYCNECNRLHTRKGYWWRKLSVLPLTAPQEQVEAVLYKAAEVLPSQLVLDLIDRWIEEGT